MKKAVLGILVVCVVVSAYFVGYSKGREYGIEAGSVFMARMIYVGSALSSVDSLRVLDEQDLSRVADLHNDQLDFILEMLIACEDDLSEIGVPQSLAEFEQNMLDFHGTNLSFKYNALAEFLQAHPTTPGRVAATVRIAEFAAAARIDQLMRSNEESQQ